MSRNPGGWVFSKSSLLLLAGVLVLAVCAVGCDGDGDTTPEDTAAADTTSADTAPPQDTTPEDTAPADTGTPVPALMPAVLDFGDIARDSGAQTLPFAIHNTGDGVLEIQSVILRTEPSLSMTYVDQRLVIDAGQVSEFLPAIIVDPSLNAPFEVTITPSVEGNLSGQIVFYTNDPTESADGLVVNVLVNVTAP